MFGQFVWVPKACSGGQKVKVCDLERKWSSVVIGHHGLSPNGQTPNSGRQAMNRSRRHILIVKEAEQIETVAASP